MSRLFWNGEELFIRIRDSDSDCTMRLSATTTYSVHYRKDMHIRTSYLWGLILKF